MIPNKLKENWGALKKGSLWLLKKSVVPYGVCCERPGPWGLIGTGSPELFSSVIELGAFCIRIELTHNPNKLILKEEEPEEEPEARGRPSNPTVEVGGFH